MRAVRLGFRKERLDMGLCCGLKRERERSWVAPGIFDIFPSCLNKGPYIQRVSGANPGSLSRRIERERERPFQDVG